MKANFNNDKSKRTDKSEMFRGGYEGMIKERKKMLPEMQEVVQDALDSWNGESITIIVMKEDENGLPKGTHTVATGVARPQMQIAMGKALNDMSEHVMEMVMEAAKENPQALVDIAEALITEINKEIK